MSLKHIKDQVTEKAQNWDPGRYPHYNYKWVLTRTGQTRMQDNKQQNSVKFMARTVEVGMGDCHCKDKIDFRQYGGRKRNSMTSILFCWTRDSTDQTAILACMVDFLRLLSGGTITCLLRNGHGGHSSDSESGDGIVVWQDDDCQTLRQSNHCQVGVTAILGPH